MKTTNRLFIAAFTMLLLFSTNSFSQEDQRPAYFTMTTMYWNLDNEGTNEEWVAAEKEYKEKVTKKNEHIRSSTYLTHLLTDNSREVIYVQTYPTWEDIEKAAARNSELEKEAWPDEAERNAFLDKQAAYFSDYHSDEIFATMAGAKLPAAPADKNMVVYIRKNKMAYPDDGSNKEFNELRMKQVENVYKKNDLIKAYYPSLHAWGDDRRDFMEVFVIESLNDLSGMFDKNGELGKDAMTEEEGKAMGKYFKGVHSDYVYTSINL
ncbi:hypothetical protein RXV94_02880 [Yeosuana sp. MJ-SS3]|uniref:Uncharacterized protein n=1 Tax=Gilvirhabdus luticola TaxID=3079858 RepID=A0ABU3U4P8_9FLAO|nr:hypothetical protein [Yeosuana sp. MJ-SS3]MDU8885090.1 hypothetical protein [Yeosuana sp. MJ-SS3]